jgi:hypothetical protein
MEAGGVVPAKGGDSDPLCRGVACSRSGTTKRERNNARNRQGRKKRFANRAILSRIFLHGKLFTLQRWSLTPV